LISFSAKVDTPDHTAQLLTAERMAQAFGLGSLNRSTTVDSAHFSGTSSGIPFMLAESGGHGMLVEWDVETHLRGMENVPPEFGMVPGRVETTGEMVRLRGPAMCEQELGASPISTFRWETS